MSRRRPPDVVFQRVTMTVGAHARHWDPSLPFNRKKVCLRRSVLFCKIDCAMLFRSSSSCSTSLWPSHKFTLDRALDVLNKGSRSSSVSPSSRVDLIDVYQRRPFVRPALIAFRTIVPGSCMFLPLFTTLPICFCEMTSLCF